MCGIAGVFGYRDAAPPVEERELLRMREHMRRRGPDGAGLWVSDDRRIGLAHRRLAIIDLSDAAAQPMWNAERTLCITYNGEIYNYRALRKELEAGGCVFRSRSDTEVLLQLYAVHGATMLDRLRGMFAFAIWDTRARTLFLARDPFGMKPLYYADDGRTLRFASQVKALVAGGAVDMAPEPAGSAGFLLWGYVPEPFTLYRAIRALPAGCWTTVDMNGNGVRAPSKFFDLAAEYRRAEDPAARPDPADVLEPIGTAIANSVARHMVADVPVSVFLSAGIDSSAIATLAARVSGSNLRCVTLGIDTYRGGPNDETQLAAETAGRLGARHDIDWLDRHTFYDELPAVMQAMDQPSVDGINSYFVARAAARQGLRVALSGLGGDELFFGYPSFRDLPRMVRAFGFATQLPGWLRRSFRMLAAPVLRPFTSPKYAGLLEYGGTYEGAYLLRRGLFMPWELPGLLGRASAREGWERLQSIPALRATRDGLQATESIVACLELGWYMRGQLLRDADWAGMAHTLEIRLPLVDVDVLRAAAPLAATAAIRSKRDIARLPALGLPRAVVERPKTGFLVPIREWLDAYSRGGHSGRRLRGWATKLSKQFTTRRSILGLVTEAYGGRGGIALYNRDLLSALCSDPATEQVVAIPRVMANPGETLPPNLRFDTSGLGGKFRYVVTVARAILAGARFDMIVCGHVNLLPMALAAAALARAPLLLVVYGVDAWQPTRSPLLNLLVRHADAVCAISRVTLDRFRAWSGVPHDRCTVLPNAIRLEDYGAGPKSAQLLARYGIAGRKVIMTLGRLSADERYKGIDEVLELMPRLIGKVPDLVYLVAGDGSDRVRLEQKAVALSVQDRVVFSGHVAEAEKADHYRLADAFVMPSRGEGFGFVFLEALACGIPVVGSRTDGGLEALRQGTLGRLVDPACPDELEEAITMALRASRQIPNGLEYFSYGNFERRCRSLVLRASLLAG
jgi:asparagine synthase (glutamine-hydrolysing)